MENQRQCSSDLVADGQKFSFDIEGCGSNSLQKYRGLDLQNNQSTKYSETLSNIPEFGDSLKVDKGSNSSIKLLMFQQHSTQDRMYGENGTRSTRPAKATKPPRPRLQLEVKFSSAPSNFIMSSNSLQVLASPTTNSSCSAAFKPSNYFSPTLKRRSLVLSGQRRVTIAERSPVSRSIGTSL